MNRSTLRIFFIILQVAFYFSCNQKSSDTSSIPADSTCTLQNESAKLTVDLHGGAFTSFTLNDLGMNPLSWKLTKADMPANNKSGAAFQGHFLCVGRWGSPTEGEINAGVPHNGEPSRDIWTIVGEKEHQVEMKVEAPLDGITIRRLVEMDALSPAFLVRETIKSNLTHGRLYNHVQHPTLGPPFLQESTIVNSNAGWGFLQIHAYPDPAVLEYRWPAAIKDSTGTTVDLTSTNGDFNYVSTHIFDPDENIGWITAATPDQKLLIGYIWKTDQYPWLNIWHHTENGKPVAKGLEFGTTGIGKPYQDLLNEATSYKGYNSFVFLDAGEQIEKSFIGFLIQINGEFQGTGEIELVNGNIVLTEKETGNTHSINTTFEL